METRIRTMVKSIGWRVIGILFLALITYLVTRRWITASIVTILHHGSFIVIYYYHDRFWLWCKWLSTSRWKPIARVFIYEIILGNLILGLITYCVTGSWKAMTLITFIYISNKLWMYIVYDKVWKLVKWQSVYVVVYTYVVGDLLHIGHLRCLEQARALGDYLVVGVIADDGVAAYKRKPIIPLEQRTRLIAGLKCVDMVVVQETIDPIDNLKQLTPDILVHGDDWGEHYPGADYMRSIGKKAVRIKYTPFISTTRIIETIKSRADLQVEAI